MGGSSVTLLYSTGKKPFYKDVHHSLKIYGHNPVMIISFAWLRIIFIRPRPPKIESTKDKLPFE